MIKVMTVVVALGSFLVFASVSPATAGLKSGKISTTLTNATNAAGPFINGTSKGTFSFKGTKASLKAKGTTVADTDGAHCTSDDIICLVTVHVTLGLGSPQDMMVLVMGEASGGTVKASHDFCKDRDSSVAPETYFFCPDFFGSVAPITASSVNAVCYAAEPTWVAAHAPGIPMSLTGHACEGVFTTVPSLPSTPLFSSGSTLLVP